MNRLPLLLTLLFPPLLFGAESASRATPGVVGAAPIAQVVVVLVLLVGLILGLAWLLRRFGGARFGGEGPVRVLGGVSLGQRERAMLLQVGETQLLVGVAPGRVQTLYILQEPVTLDTRGGERFSDRLAAAMQRRGGES